MTNGNKTVLAFAACESNYCLPDFSNGDSPFFEITGALKEIRRILAGRQFLVDRDGLYTLKHLFMGDKIQKATFHSGSPYVFIDRDGSVTGVSDIVGFMLEKPEEIPEVNNLAVIGSDLTYKTIYPFVEELLLLRVFTVNPNSFQFPWYGQYQKITERYEKTAISSWVYDVEWELTYFGKDSIAKPAKSAEPLIYVEEIGKRELFIVRNREEEFRYLRSAIAGYHAPRGHERHIRLQFVGHDWVQTIRFDSKEDRDSALLQLDKLFS